MPGSLGTSFTTCPTTSPVIHATSSLMNKSAKLKLVCLFNGGESSLLDVGRSSILFVFAHGETLLYLAPSKPMSRMKE